MDRDELLALDKEALVELIVRLYERVTELEARVDPAVGRLHAESVRASADEARVEEGPSGTQPPACHPGRDRAVSADRVLGCGAALAETGQNAYARLSSIAGPSPLRAAGLV